ncbi:flavin reductase [uncultured Senegalimassilia sp.]|uniref:flavin reductase n=1 Tax=uncultured Senegalimassilia sp. TaxID=1714350 RepID=UPI003450A753
MFDKQAFHSLSYGMYVIGTRCDGRDYGCVANTFAQVTSSPLQVSVALNKENATTAAVRQAGRFTASCLSEQADMQLIGTFGFHTSTELDKFAQHASARDEAGMPYVAEQCCAWFSAKVVAELDLGTHVLFVGEVQECAKVADAAAPMTYAFYHQVKGGKTPPKASSYLGDEQPAAAPAESNGTEQPKIAWRCTICGHMEYVDELPDDFVCPVCGVGKEFFERVEL